MSRGCSLSSRATYSSTGGSQTRFGSGSNGKPPQPLILREVVLVLPITVLLVLPTTVLLVLPTTMLLILLLGCRRARRRGVASRVAFFLRAPRRSGGGLGGARLEELEGLKELEGLIASAKSWSFFTKPPFFGMFQSPANTMKRVFY
jgi:hypothetical protein